MLHEKEAPLEVPEVLDWADMKERFEDTSDESDSDSEGERFR